MTDDEEALAKVAAGREALAHTRRLGRWKNYLLAGGMVINAAAVSVLALIVVSDHASNVSLRQAVISLDMQLGVALAANQNSATVAFFEKDIEAICRAVGAPCPLPPKEPERRH